MRIILSLLVCFIMTLPPISFAQEIKASPDTEITYIRQIPGIGSLTFPKELELLLIRENSESIYHFLVNDNGTWRTSQVYFSPPFTGIYRNNIKDNSNLIDAVISGFALKLINTSSTSSLLQNTPINLLALSNEPSIIKSTTVLHNRRAMHFDYYAIDGTEGIRLLSVLSVDSDRDYWRQTISNVIANIQR